MQHWLAVKVDIGQIQKKPLRIPKKSDYEEQVLNPYRAAFPLFQVRVLLIAFVICAAGVALARSLLKPKLIITTKMARMARIQIIPSHKVECPTLTPEYYRHYILTQSSMLPITEPMMLLSLIPTPTPASIHTTPETHDHGHALRHDVS